jgi:hypothetical protein
MHKNIMEPSVLASPFATLLANKRQLLQSEFVKYLDFQSLRAMLYLCKASHRIVKDSLKRATEDSYEDCTWEVIGVLIA